MPNPDLRALGVRGAAAAIADGSLTPVDLVEASLATIAAREPDVSAFAVVDAAGARRQARRLTDELAAGPPRSPLHGLPIGVKDLIDVAGLPTRAGSGVLADAPPAADDAPVVARLRAAGAIVVGKTHTHEFALGSMTPQTRHPLDRDRIVGGSSGGSAAAVAAGEVLLALGTDTGGSVRTPAALCGVAGLKPRWGLLPVAGIVPLSPLLDVCGLIASGADDLAACWDTLTTQSDHTFEGLRVVTAGRRSLGDCEDGVWAHVSDAVTRLASVPSVTVRPVDLPAFDDWNPARSTVLTADALAEHRNRGWYPQRAERYGRTMRTSLQRATELSATDVTAALRVLRPLITRLDSALDDADALVLPTVSRVAPLRRELEDEAATGGPGDGRALLRLCAPFNWLRVAAVSVPVGTVDGLPVGAQVVARTEATALRVGAHLQDVSVDRG